MIKPLFQQERLRDLIRNCPRSIRREVDKWERGKVLDNSESDLIERLETKYRLDAPSFRSQDQWRKEPDGDYYISIRIPFDGDAALFDYRPSNRNANPPRAVVSIHEPVLFFTVRVPQDSDEGQAMLQEIDETVANIESYLEWIRQDCKEWNDRLPTIAADCITKRKNQLLLQERAIDWIAGAFQQSEAIASSEGKHTAS